MSKSVKTCKKFTCDSFFIKTIKCNCRFNRFSRFDFLHTVAVFGTPLRSLLKHLLFHQFFAFDVLSNECSFSKSKSTS